MNPFRIQCLAGGAVSLGVAGASIVMTNPWPPEYEFWKVLFSAVASYNGVTLIFAGLFWRAKA